MPRVGTSKTSTNKRKKDNKYRRKSSNTDVLMRKRSTPAEE
jgi:hypothetical protein